MIPALDISNVNGHVDLAPYRSRGFRLVGVKATEGLNFNDGLLAENIAQATKLGMVVLPYHFARPDSNKGMAGGVAEAKHFLSVIRPFFGNRLVGQPVLDYERTPDAAFAVAFLQVLHAAGLKPIVYVSASRVSELRGRVPVSTRFWVADWGVSQLPDLGVPVVIWQWTDRLDNRFDGDRVLVDPKTLLRHVPHWYLVARAHGRVVAKVRTGHGRTKRFFRHQLPKLIKQLGNVRVKRVKR